MSTAPAAAGGGTGVVRLARFGESPAALTFRRNEPSEPLSAALVALAELRQADALPPGTHGLIKEMLLGQAHDATVAGLLAAYDVERDGLELRDSLARFAQRLAAHGAPADFASYRPPAPPAPPAAPPVPQTLVPTPPAVPVRREEVRVLHEASDEDDDERDARADEALPFPSLPPLRDPGACVATGGEWRALDDGAVLCYAANAAAHAAPGGGGRVAVFGWEGTLVASGAGELLRPHAAPAFLRALSRGGYRLVVADHARAMGRGVERADYEQLTARLAAAIGAPLLFLLSCAPSHRPPAAPFLRLLAAHVPTAAHERADSFVVGSAAGRGGDRSAADRLMARRLRLAFRTPEELWDDAPPAPFAWRRAAAAAPPAPLIVGSPDARTVSEEELQALPPPALVLLVGAPAAGKTFAARRLWTRPGWAVVAPDATLVAAALGAGLGVLVDGAPPAAAARAPFLELARAHGVAAHALLLGTSEATAAVLSRLRVALGEARREAARGATAAFKRAYTPPTHAEGFASVLLLPFAPAFDSAHAAATYRSLLAA